MGNRSSSPVLRVLNNGVRVCFEPFEGAQSFAMCLRFVGGVGDEPAEKLGLANVTELAVMKGTDRKDAAGVFDALDSLGVSRSVNAGAEAFTFRAHLLPAKVGEALLIYREVFESAAFPEDEVALAKRLTLEQIKSLEDQPQRKIVLTSLRAALGFPLGRPKPGTEASVTSLDRDDVVRFWDRIAHPAALILTAAGGMEEGTFFEAVEKALLGWHKAGAVPDAHPVRIAPGVVHELKKSEQAHIAVIYPGPPRDAGDFYAAQVAATVLSGSGSSRLFTEVREKRGLVYTVSTAYSPFRSGAITLLYAGTRADRTDETLKVCLAEVNRLAEDISAEEFERAKSVILGRLRTVGELVAARSSSLVDDLLLQGTPRSLEDILDGVSSVTLEQARAAARHYTPTPRTIAVLGPQEPGETR
ncbi:MAG: insulinase family protein [Deltaproteobacteria bacterium]|nr:insulinase family protein [Deltaproteobacteria bacterium]